MQLCLGSALRQHLDMTICLLRREHAVATCWFACAFERAGCHQIFTGQLRQILCQRGLAIVQVHLAFRIQNQATADCHSNLL